LNTNFTDKAQTDFSNLLLKTGQTNNHLRHLNKLVSFVTVLILLPFLLSAQSSNIIPLPKSIVKGDSVFHLKNDLIIQMSDKTLAPQAQYLQNELGTKIPVDNTSAGVVINLQLVKSTGVPGAYSLKIAPETVTIKAADNQGIFYGIISFLQLVKAQPVTNITLPACEITDAPRYQWRGFMLDESRHFFGKEKVKQLLNWMAFYKLNRFHWHLTMLMAGGWKSKNIRC
jgi:hexosaminidase